MKNHKIEPLTVGSVLKTVELREYVGASAKQWEKHKVKYLQHLETYYVFEEFKRGKYRILNILGKYQPYIQGREQARMSKDKLYEKLIIELIQEDDIQTATNLANIIHSRGLAPTGHVGASTVYSWTNETFKRLILENKIVVYDLVWTKIDKENHKYIELTEDELSIYQTIRDSIEPHYDKDISIYLELAKDGILTWDQANKKMNPLFCQKMIHINKAFSDRLGYSVRKTYRLSINSIV